MRDKRKTVFVDTSDDDDCIYFDPAWDAGMDVRLNRDAKMEGKDTDLVQAQSSMVKEVLNCEKLLLS
jgi:hypothetical protein